MTRVAQAMRACRLLRPLSSVATASLYQTASITAGCQASTSGSDHESFRNLLAFGGQIHSRLFASASDSSSTLRAKEVLAALREPPSSLQFDRGDVVVPPDLDNPIGRTVLRMMGFESKRSKLLYAAQRLLGAVIEHCDTGVLQRAFDNGKLFWGTYVMMELHLWMLLRRLQVPGGLSPSDVKFFKQQFYNEFQRDVEYRVYAAGVQIGVTKWLKKLELHFYETAYELDMALAPCFPPGSVPNPALAGIPASFDVGCRARVADVILRKYYGGEEKHSIDADLLAYYTIRELKCLALTDEAAVLRGHVRFTSGGGHLAGALRRAGVTVPRGLIHAEEEADGPEGPAERQGNLGAPRPLHEEVAGKGGVF